MSKKEESKVTMELPTGQVIPVVYSNASITNYSPYEFEITLGLASSNYEGVRPVVNIRMSPQFAKEFSRIMSGNVVNYEERFGKIISQEEEMKKQ